MDYQERKSTYILIKDFSDYRKSIITPYFPGWKKFKTSQLLKDALEEFNKKEHQYGKYIIPEPAQYPCIVEIYEDKDPEETWDDGFRMQFLYKNNLTQFRDLFNE